MKTAFLTGLVDGMSSARYAFNPPVISTRIDHEVLKPSYRSPEEDKRNIQSDFDKAVTHVRQEIANQANQNR